MENKKSSDISNIDDKLLKQIEKAAEKGARRGSGNNFSIMLTLIAAAVIAIVVLAVVSKLNGSVEDLRESFNNAFNLENSAEEHDSVLKDNGLLGYTVSDFSSVILGDNSQLKKIEVYKQEISDAAELTETGLFRLSAFTKYQCITYYGTAVYTVDLSKLRQSDFSLDDTNKIVSLKIPHAVQEELNIPEDKIEFGDVNTGLLAFGEITVTPEQASQLQSDVRERMEEKLTECRALENADRFAVLSVWELYSPLIKKVAPNYSLEVELK